MRSLDHLLPPVPPLLKDDLTLLTHAGTGIDPSDEVDWQQRCSASHALARRLADQRREGAVMEGRNDSGELAPGPSARFEYLDSTEQQTLTDGIGIGDRIEAIPAPSRITALAIAADQIANCSLRRTGDGCRQEQCGPTAVHRSVGIERRKDVLV